MDRRDDLATVTAAPKTFRLDGADYAVPKLRPREMGEIQAWIKSRFPDPRVEARLAIQDCKFESLAHKIWEAAEAQAKEWPPKFGSSRVEAELATADGFGFMVWILLRRTVPGLDQARARELADRLEAAEFKQLLTLAMPEGLDDPKA